MRVQNQFKIARLIQGLTQYEVSQMTSPRISPARISLFEHGHIELRTEELRSLADILEIEDDAKPENAKHPTSN